MAFRPSLPEVIFSPTVVGSSLCPGLISIPLKTPSLVYLWYVFEVSSSPWKLKSWPCSSFSVSTASAVNSVMSLYSCGTNRLFLEEVIPTSWSVSSTHQLRLYFAGCQVSWFSLYPKTLPSSSPGSWFAISLSSSTSLYGSVSPTTIFVHLKELDPLVFYSGIMFPVCPYDF